MEALVFHPVYPPCDLQPVVRRLDDSRSSRAPVHFDLGSYAVSSFVRISALVRGRYMTQNNPKERPRALFFPKRFVPKQPFAYIYK